MNVGRRGGVEEDARQPGPRGRAEQVEGRAGQRNEGEGRGGGRAEVVRSTATPRLLRQGTVRGRPRASHIPQGGVPVVS